MPALAAPYEIWSTTQSVRFQGRVVYTAFATPAVFDPITVLNPANPTELVYAWDARVAAIKQFTDDWSGIRGCDRESYAQPGYWYNRRPDHVLHGRDGRSRCSRRPARAVQQDAQRPTV